jgi:signal transduction histidine kinase
VSAHACSFGVADQHAAPPPWIVAFPGSSEEILDRNRPSLRARRTLEAGALAALLCAAFGVLFLLTVGDQDAQSARVQATAGWNRVLPLVEDGRLPSVLPDSTDGQYQEIQVLDAQNRVVAASRHLLGKPPITTARSKGARSQRTLCHPAGLTGCMTVVSVKVDSQPGGSWLINVAVPSVPWYGNSTMLSVAIGASLLITVIIAGCRYRSATKDEAQLETLQAELTEITASNLHRRVAVPDNNQYAMRYLVERVNGTLDLLEDCYHKTRRFTADASHDLRSPITAMRVQVEEALMHPDDFDWLRTANSLLTDLERLQAIVTDLLTLARLDSQAPTTREVTDLTRLVGAELDHRTFRVRVARDLQPDVVIDCDRLQIKRLLANLLDNAERHATAQVTVIVRADAATATLEVIDDGDGIPAEHRETVFDRFTRLDSARDRDSGGTGLGLAIARQVAQAHKGTLTIQESLRGARFVLCIPVCDPVPDH